MIVTKKFSFDLDTRGISPLMYAVQGDVNTRKVETSLFSNGTAWEIPDGTVVAVAYRKPDGTSGLYDKLPSGESASEVSGNVVTVMLAPQVLTCAGNVVASVVFYSQDMADTLATFSFQIHVEKNPGAGQQISNNYYALQNLEQVNTAYNDLLERVESLEKGGSGQNGNGLTETASNLLITILRDGIYSSDQSANITALATELGVVESGGGDTPDEPDEPDAPVVTLSSISATYNGGDVTVGTAVTDLTDIVVTAHYSDGSTETVTDYALFGEIAEGENTVTVAYQDKTTTFAVTGVAESGGDIGEGNGWVDGQAYELNKVDCLSLDTTTGETVEASAGTMVTDFLPCLGVSAISWEGYDNASIMSNVLYDEEKNLIKANGLLTATDPAQGATNVYATLAYYYIIPKGSAYIRLTQRSSIKYLTSVTPHKYPVLTETTECETGRWYESGAVLGSLNANNGTLTVDDEQTWYVTGYCMVYGASKVHFSQSTRKSVVFYDGNKNYISGTTVNNTTMFEIPENAVYMAAYSVDMNNLHIWLEA